MWNRDVNANVMPIGYNLVGAFNQEQALIGAFSMIVKSSWAFVWSSTVSTTVWPRAAWQAHFTTTDCPFRYILIFIFYSLILSMTVVSGNFMGIVKWKWKVRNTKYVKGFIISRYRSSFYFQCIFSRENPVCSLSSVRVNK